MQEKTLCLQDGHGSLQNIALKHIFNMSYAANSKEI